VLQVQISCGSEDRTDRTETMLAVFPYHRDLRNAEDWMILNCVTQSPKEKLITGMLNNSSSATPTAVDVPQRRVLAGFTGCGGQSE